MKGIMAVFLLAAIAPSAAYGAETEFARQFRETLYSGDQAKTNELVKGNVAVVPEELDNILDDAFIAWGSKADREMRFYLAEALAEAYKDASNDIAPLKRVKKRILNSRLTGQIRSKAINGVHVVHAVSTVKSENIFTPDNIIVKKGETVKWLNKDRVAHLLASLPVVGLTGIFSPEIAPGQDWSYRFDKPGEYYYICFIHKTMYGKITVEDAQAQPAPPVPPAPKTETKPVKK